MELLLAGWKNDFGRRQHYDGQIVGIDSIYWGGPPHTGVASLIIDFDTPDGVDCTDLARQEFEADTEEDLKRQIEVWAQERMNEVVALIKAHYKPEQEQP